MKIWDVKGFFENLYPKQSVEVDLDDYCIVAFEHLAIDKKLNLFGHIVFNKAKVTINRIESFYTPIENHRQAVGAVEMRKKFASFKDVNLPDDVLKNLKELKRLSNLSIEEKEVLSTEEKKEAESATSNLASFKSDLMSASGLTEDAINKQLNYYING